MLIVLKIILCCAFGSAILYGSYKVIKFEIDSFKQYINLEKMKLQELTYIRKLLDDFYFLECFKTCNKCKGCKCKCGKRT